MKSNNEIREPFTGGETGLKRNVNILTINEVEKIQDETRKDERAKVIHEANLSIAELEKLWKTACDKKEYAEASFILYIIESKQDYSKIQEICQRDKLGLGGERVVDTLIKGYEDLKSQLKTERERVIEEIEKHVNKYIFKATTDNAEKAINRHYANILAELNNLKGKQ